MDRDYILIAEGGGWPTHAIGPFDSFEMAETHMESDKWRASWGSITDDPRDLRLVVPE
jgi:hypothetical protein